MILPDVSRSAPARARGVLPPPTAGSRPYVIGMRRHLSVLSLALGLWAVAGAIGLPAASHGQGRDAGGEQAILVIMRGLRNDRGVASAGLYDSAGTWTHSGEEVATCHAPVTNGVSRCRLEGMAPGRYAIGVMHDEDADGHFDTGFLGIPDEGYGFSRDARGTLSAPSFESAAFDYGGGVQALLITMRYGV